MSINLSIIEKTKDEEKDKDQEKDEEKEIKYEEKKKLKGVPKVVVENEITLKDYRDCVLENKKKSVDGINCIESHKLQNFMITYSKKCLENTDDKRVWDGIYSKAIGHYSLK